MSLNSNATRTSDTPKRVCMIAYTNYRFDGRVRLEAESLVKWGYEVFFIIPKGTARPRAYELEGVRLIELNVSKYRGKNRFHYILSYLTFLGLASIVCTRLFIRSHVKVIHVHNMPDVLVFAALIARLFGCKLVLDLHDTVPETYEGKFENPFRLVMGLLRLEERVCCALAHKIICVNHVQRDAVVRRGIAADKIATVITMPEHIFPARGQKKSKQEPAFRMVNHGTISKRLGNDIILGAAAKLVHLIPGFELHFIGLGDNLDQLLSLSESLGLGDHVHFHPSVPWDQLAEKLSIMDVGIVANRLNVATELMLPSKLIDYVVLNIPAIVPRLKAIQYYFSPDMVAYFEPEDVDSIVATTLNLYRDDGRRRVQVRNARKFLDDNRWDDPQRGLKALYEDLFKDTKELHSSNQSDTNSSTPYVAVSTEKDNDLRSVKES
jgi:glycosyltransferase involved in cell wall biosynthesis